MITSVPSNSAGNSSSNNSSSNGASNHTNNSNNSPSASNNKNNNSNTAVTSSSNSSSQNTTAASTTLTTAATPATTAAPTITVAPSSVLTTLPGIVAAHGVNLAALTSTPTTTPLSSLTASSMATTPGTPVAPPLMPSIVLSSTTSNQNNGNIRAMQSDEDFNIRFVNLVRQHRCLYDKKVAEYRNRDNQEKAWALISQETRENVIHCKERWRNLRACLSRYIKQQSGSDPQHKPYYLTEHMAFLLPFLKSTRNSLDGNNSLAQLYQFSQQQYQFQQQQQQPSTTTNGLQILPHFGTSHQSSNHMPNGSFNEANGLMNLGHDMKHSISENDDEETIDAFDPAFTNNMQQMQRNNTSSPALSDTASAITLQNFIPDVQLSELPTSEGTPDISYLAQQQQQHLHHHHQPAHQHGVTIIRRSSNDYPSHPHQPAKKIKTECHASEATTTASMTLFNGENSDMEFFRSILPDISMLTPQQKRKFKIGILELIDDVIDRYPAERTTTTNHIIHNNNNNNNNNHLINNNNCNTNNINNNSSSVSTKQRRNSNREWRR